MPRLRSRSLPGGTVPADPADPRPRARTRPLRLVVGVGILALAACDPAGVPDGLPTPTPTPSSPSAVALAPEIPLSPGETIRAERSGDGPAHHRIDMAGASPVFVVRAACTPGVTLHVEMSGPDLPRNELDVPCDRVVSSRTTVHDPEQTPYELLTVDVDGEGVWSVVLADSSETFPDAS